MHTTTYHFETLALHAGQEQPDPANGARVVPIYQTASYVFDNCAHAEARFNLTEPGNIYSRLTNPTQEAFEKRIATLEGGVGALAVASGSAAITYAILNLAKQGEHIVSAETIYGGTYNLFSQTISEWGIETTFVDPVDLDAVGSAFRPTTKALFVETVGNPNATLCDLQALSAIAHAHHVPLVVDNTFATPYLVRPIESGADIVVHSATKFIGGHGTSLGGVIIDSGAFDWKASGKFPALSEPNPSYHGISFTEAAKETAWITKARAVLLRDTGACLSPWHSFLFLQGLETLSLRVERHVQNTLAVVNYLANHDKVAKVNHPSLEDNPYHALYKRYFPNGGISIFTFDIKGSKADAQTFIDSLRIFSLLANVADVKSLVIHPGSTTHAQLSKEALESQGITDTTIRLSIGCEHIDDLLADLDQAFAQVGGPACQ
ncbi:O-acetylhomoserine aminocarboxypropyltransferase/cysteine synthase family protein [Sphaerochaeta sp.]|uniref:O-acetylhomoserine aminocarboxypropyltransferase/cysteine synthase family protein n=1 Tax=Sphaerochaeta sp. TaxID=1972642 RepID=UPI002FC85B6A